MLEQSLANGRSTTHYEIEHARRDTRPDDDVGQGVSSCRDEIGRLQDDAIAVGERRGDFPRWNGNGKIPRRDQPDDANRLARYLDVDTGPHRRDFVTGEAQAFTGKEQEDLPRPHHLADAFGKRFPFLAREQSAEFIPARKDLVADPLKDVMP